MGVQTGSEEHLPKDARLLVHDAGYIAWGTKFALHDMVGLKTPRSVAYHRDQTWLTCVEAARKGHSIGEMGSIVGAARGRAISELGKEAKSTHLVVLRGWNEVFGITAHLASNGWKLDQLRDAPTGYDVYALTPPR